MLAAEATATIGLASSAALTNGVGRSAPSDPRKKRPHVALRATVTLQAAASSGPRNVEPQQAPSTASAIAAAASVRCVAIAVGHGTRPIRMPEEIDTTP